MANDKEKAQLARVSASSDVEASSGAGDAAKVGEIVAAMQKHNAAQQKLYQEREKHAKQLAAVTIKKEDVDLLASEWDHVPRAALERHLRQCGGDVQKVLKQLAGLEPLSTGP